MAKNPLGKGLADLARPGDRRAVGRMASPTDVALLTASFRPLRETPGHITYGVWFNGGKCGDLVLRQNEARAFEEAMQRAGFFLASVPND